MEQGTIIALEVYLDVLELVRGKLVDLSEKEALDSDKQELLELAEVLGSDIIVWLDMIIKGESRKKTAPKGKG